MLSLPLLLPLSFRYLKRRVSPSPPPQLSSGSSPQPPPAKKQKKQKQRGQNKHRPRTKVPFSEQLCPSVYLFTSGHEQACRFGNSCKYIHDLDSYLAVKPPDIGDQCYMFNRFGRCPYGLACRFSSTHISSSHENITNELLYDASRPRSVRNVLGKELQEKLRKRKLLFLRSEHYLSQLKIESGDGVRVKCEGGDCGEVMMEKVDGEEVAEDEIVEREVKEDECQRSLGCVTDKDTVGLRAAEKKKVL